MEKPNRSIQNVIMLCLAFAATVNEFRERYDSELESAVYSVMRTGKYDVRLTYPNNFYMKLEQYLNSLPISADFDQAVLIYIEQLSKQNGGK